MSDQSAIRFDPASLARSSTSGSCTGKLFLSLGEVDFPERRWSDFPLWAVCDWFQELTAFDNSRRAGTFSLRFFDGPYLVRALTPRALTPSR